jgi:hypothetical protein
MGAGDGQYSPSWIWTAPSALALPSEGSDAEQREVSETARHEWMTCRARADCWVEERELLQEEMRRVIVYLEWKSRWWSEKIGSRVDSSASDIQRGADAYARKQAHINRDIAIQFASQWLPYLQARGLDTKWATLFPRASKVLSSQAKLPKWFPKPSQDTPREPPPMGPSPGSTERLGTTQQRPDARSTPSEAASCKGEEQSNDHHEGPGSKHYDEDDDYNSEDSDDEDYHEEDNNNNNSDDRVGSNDLGFEYDDDYMA